jgi:hypothetical protein
MSTAVISFGSKLGLLNNATIGEAYYDQLRPLLRGLDALIQGSVLSTSLTTPPSSPNDGDAYLILGSPSGAWTGNEGKIAVWSNQVTQSGTDTLTPSWDFYTPQAGWLIWVSNLTEFQFYDGSSWAQFSGGGSQVNSDWNANSGVAQILNRPSLSLVATSGSYTDLTNQPTLGTAAAQPTSAFDASGTSAAETTRAEAAEALLVPKTVTVNGHALSANIVVSASDLTTGTLPHAQLPALLSADIPANAANTTGSAAALTTARTINGTAFDGSANITITAAGSTLTGSSLPVGITTASGLTTVAGGTFGTAAFTASSAYDVAGAAATAQTNAEAAFTGDVTKSSGSFATTVMKVNGGAISTTGKVQKSNGSGQFVDATTSDVTTPVVFALTDGSTIALNWTNGDTQTVTITGNRTFTFSNPVAGRRYVIEVTQDTTGSRTLTWPTIRWQGGTAPTLTTTASKTDLIVLLYDGSSYFGQSALNF